MIYHTRVYLISAKVQLLEMMASPFMLFIALLQPFFIAITAIYMLRNQAGFEPVYVVVGAGLSGMFSLALFTGTNAVMRERYQGDGELLEASPAPCMVHNPRISAIFATWRLTCPPPISTSSTGEV